ncbi:MAG TPA: SusC/RagA family TonB-linked outer membrane protein [Longimicrobiales bacterium]|nr:SusC/RagA family TonB-linked outer membrane protein [Longimicrobiales bacterium]
MRAVRTTLLSVVLVFGAAFLTEATAQNTGTVTGQVTDASTGAPLTSVQMQVAGTNVGGLTDQQGRYLLTRVPAGTQQIRAVIIGYAQETVTVTVAAGGTATADFQLRTSAVPLEAVIVSAATGREQRARELGSNVANIEVQDLNPAPITSMADALGGRAAGVVMQDVNGTTGSAQRIRIRGANSLSLSNEPLVYIDGVRMNNNFAAPFSTGGQETSRLNDINPNDIQSVEIVKGPAASSLYGTAGANGVILITTKRGRPGATQWTFFAETGKVEDVTDYPANFAAVQVNDPNQPMFDPETGFPNIGFNPATSPYTYCWNRAAAAGTCRQDEALVFNTLMDSRTRPFVEGFRQRWGASARGGTEDVRFFVSGQVEEEQGVFTINTQDKANLRGNLDARLSQQTDISFSFGYTDSNLVFNPNDNHIFSPILNGLLGTPFFIPDNPDDEWSVHPSNYGFGMNYEQIAVRPSPQDADRYILSSTLRHRPTSWLTLNATGGLDYASTHTYITLQPNGPQGWLHYTWEQGHRQSERQSTYLYTGQGSAVSTFELTPALISTTTLGASYTLDNTEETTCYGISLVPGTASCGTTADEFFVDENFFEIRTIGGYVNQDFAWRDLLFVSAGIRADDNSAFGAESDLAYYPSASLSWVVAEEPWFPQLDFLNTLRLRTSWGVSGLRPGFRDAITLFSPTTVASAAGDVPGAVLSVTGNAGLKPERSSEWEIGFDTGLFNDRLSVEFTYFDKESEDALINRRLPGSLGLTTTVFDNLGAIENQGTELGLNLRVYESDAVGLNLGVTNSTLKNTVFDIGQDDGVEDIIFNRGLQRHTPGYTAGGFWQQPYRFDDANGDGLLTNDEVELISCDTTVDAECDDEVFIGPSLPTWQRTLFADLRLFDWVTVSTLFEGRGGHYTGNDSEAFRCGFRSTRGCAAVGNPDAPLDEQARYIADRFLGSAYGFVEKADFYKWRELSVTLSAPGNLPQRFQPLQGLRLTVAGRNLATWTDYTGLDPETVEGGGNVNFSQSEFNTQPPVRYLMLRLDYNF